MRVLGVGKTDAPAETDREGENYFATRKRGKTSGRCENVLLIWRPVWMNSNPNNHSRLQRFASNAKIE